MDTIYLLEASAGPVSRVIGAYTTLAGAQARAAQHLGPLDWVSNPVEGDDYWYWSVELDGGWLSITRRYVDLTRARRPVEVGALLV